MNKLLLFFATHFLTTKHYSFEQLWTLNKLPWTSRLGVPVPRISIKITRINRRELLKYRIGKFICKLETCVICIMNGLIEF